MPRLIFLLQSIVLVALLGIGGFCLTLTHDYSKKIALLHNPDQETRFLQLAEKQSSPGVAVVIKTIMESKAGAVRALEADHRFIQNTGELLFIFAFFQLAAIIISIKTHLPATLTTKK